MAFRIKPRESGPIPKPVRRRQKAHRTESAQHLVFVRSLPCLASGMNGFSEAHHLTVARYRMGRRLGDDCAVPLHRDLHGDTRGPQALHAMGERNFWNQRGIDPRPIAQFLWDNTGDYDACIDVIMGAIKASHSLLAKGEKVFDVR